jgi:hypothetical protein
VFFLGFHFKLRAGFTSGSLLAGTAGRPADVEPAAEKEKEKEEEEKMASPPPAITPAPFQY